MTGEGTEKQSISLDRVPTVEHPCSSPEKTETHVGAAVFDEVCNERRSVQDSGWQFAKLAQIESGIRWAKDPKSFPAASESFA